MAIEKSENLIKKAFDNAYSVPDIKNKFLKKIIRVFLIQLLTFIRMLKYFMSTNVLHPFLFYFSFNINNKNNSMDISSKNLSQYSGEYNSNNFLFLENFIDVNFYSKLLSDFPKKKYFKNKNDPTKFYYWGFEYLNNRNKKYLNFDGKLISKFQYVEQYYNYILSNIFRDNFSKLLSNKNLESQFSLKIISINATYADEGAFLIPHKDTAYLGSESKEIIHNCIYFVDGNDSMIEESGGTGLYLDNEFQKKVLVPSTLKNSLLVYNTKANLFHGFNFMKKNSFRKAFAFQIMQKKL
jgi:hypothetical protein